MNVVDYMVQDAVAIANNNIFGYKNSYPNTFWDGRVNGDCGAFCSRALHDALLKIGIDTGTQYYEPQGGWSIYNEAFLLKYCDRYNYDDERNQKGDILISAGHTVMIASVHEDNGKSYDEIVHARNDDDGVSGDSGGREICVQALYDGSWHYIYRLKAQYNKELDSEEKSEEITEVTRFNMEDIWTVKKGESGGHVRSLQALLNSKNGAGLVVDGSCGDITVAAIKAYQQKYGLTVDGIAGPVTQNDLYCRNI